MALIRIGRGRQYPGQYLGGRGRVCVYLGRRHPLANRGGWIRRSRLVISEKLGRKLGPEEHVDHLRAIDDDRLSSLRHYEDGREHNRRHAKGRRRDERGRFA